MSALTESGVDTSQMTAAELAAYKRRWFALLLLSMSLMLIVIDTTIVNIAFPSIRETFNASFADAEWVNSIYSLVFGAALITWGKLGDQYGRRNVFVGGATVFAIGSLGCGLAPNIGTLIFFRAVQGMGGAMMSPSTLSIVSATFKGKERGIAFGIWGATAGVSAALGPLLGGWLIEYGTGITAESWRLAFLVNLPISLIAIAGSFWAIREIRSNIQRHRIDWLGIVTASLAFGSIVFGAIEGQNYGWLQATKVFTLGPISYPVLPEGVTVVPAGTVALTPFIFAFGLIMLALFVIIEVWQERRGLEPLFEFSMLRFLSFRYGLLTVLIVALGEFGIVLVLSIYFQLAQGLSAFETGVALLPFAAALLVGAPVAGILSSRFGAKWVVTAGMALETIGLFWFSRILYVDTPYITLAVPLILYGAGVGLAIAQLANISLSDVPPEKAGVASGALNTLRQIGASLGIAIVGAILFGTFASEAKPLIRQSTMFEDFSARAAANTEISREAQIIGAQVGTFSDTIKSQIEAGLDNNEGFGDNADFMGTMMANIPTVARTALRLQGVDLDDAEVVARIQRDLEPDAEILAAEVQHALGAGFSTAGRSAVLVASVFVFGGALCSLMIPNKRARRRAESEAEAVVMAH
ncbi:MAG: MFS transporter [Burkholderiales bacterium]|nr:MFS transporter [Anaerolineae bacterium]